MWHLQRLRRVSLLLFFFSQVLYLSSEPQGFSIQAQARRSDYRWYRGRSGISTRLLLGRKQGLTQENFAQTSLKQGVVWRPAKGSWCCWICTKQTWLYPPFPQGIWAQFEALFYKTSSILSIRGKSLIFFFFFVFNPPFQVTKQRGRVFLLPILWKTFSV